jgi:cytochrome P450
MLEENGFAEHRSIRFIAFGVGPRACVGRRFAELQIQTVLALMVARFNFKPAPNTPVKKFNVKKLN